MLDHDKGQKLVIDILQWIAFLFSRMLCYEMEYEDPTTPGESSEHSGQRQLCRLLSCLRLSCFFSTQVGVCDFGVTEGRPSATPVGRVPHSDGRGSKIQTWTLVVPHSADTNEPW